MTQNPLHIAIDGNEANVTRRVGSNVYAFELLQELYQLLKDTPHTSVTVLLSSPPIKEFPRTRKNWRYRVLTPKPLWTQLALPIHLFFAQKKYDVLFTAGHYAPRISSVPYVSSVMDLAFLEYPDQFTKKDYLQLRDWTSYSVKNAQKVIAISEFTKSEVVKQYQKNSDEIVLAYPAVRPTQHRPTNKDGAKVAKKFGITKPYIVHLGTIQPRKNIERLIEAFEKVQRQTAARTNKMSRQPNSYQLVLVGKIGWLAEPILDRVTQSPFSQDIIITGFTTEYEKQTLLSFAQCSAHLGLYEGFGIPALEALYANTVPLVAKNTSLPEVVGEAGISCNPTSVGSIANGLSYILGLTAKERAALRRAGRIHRQKFSWQTSAQTVLETLEQVAKTQSS